MVAPERLRAMIPRLWLKADSEPPIRPSAGETLGDQGHQVVAGELLRVETERLHRDGQVGGPRLVQLLTRIQIGLGVLLDLGHQGAQRGCVATSPDSREPHGHIDGGTGSVLGGRQVPDQIVGGTGGIGSGGCRCG